ncbi:MAG: LPO_1073/Vpar_1526 family protein [Bacillota bacterium]
MAGALVTKLAESGVEWLARLVEAHSPAVQQQARENVRNFMIRLAQRVERLEAELPATARDVFDRALDHPGCSLLMKKAMLSAAVTSNDDRHEMLVELIAQRLTADENDMVALVGGAACDVVNALAPKHIQLLGLMARLMAIRPSKVIEAHDQDTYDRFVLAWWAPLAKLTSGLDRVFAIDFDHLAGLGCIRISVGEWNLQNVLSIASQPKQMTVTMNRVQETEWWPDMHRLVEAGMKHAWPTSIGSLIGTLYHDRQIGQRTTIEWD